MMPPGIIFEAACGALARQNAYIGLRARSDEDNQFHMARSEAFMTGAKLPPAQLRMVLFLSAKWPKQFRIVGRGLVPGGGVHPRAIIPANPDTPKPSGLLNEKGTQ